MPRRLAARLQATPLRSRLVGLLLLLVAAALLVAGAATVAALRGYLFNQVDRNLADMARPIASAQFRPLPDDGRRPSPAGTDRSGCDVRAAVRRDRDDPRGVQRRLDGHRPPGAS